LDPKYIRWDYQQVPRQQRIYDIRAVIHSAGKPHGRGFDIVANRLKRKSISNMLIWT
jgi:hypothetical protein